MEIDEHYGAVAGDKSENGKGKLEKGERAAAQRLFRSFEDDQSRNWHAGFFLLGREDAMGFGVDGEGVNGVGHADVAESFVVVGIFLLEDADRAGIAGDVNTAEAGIEGDDVRAGRHGEKSDGEVALEIEDGH